MGNVNIEMKKVMFNNTRKMIIEQGSLDNPSNVLLAVTINKKLEPYGMALDAQALRMLSTQTANEMSVTWSEMKQIIDDVSGAKHFNGPLFYANFPEEVMAHDEASLYLNSMFYYLFSQSNDKMMTAIADELHAIMSEEKRDRLPLLEEYPRDLKIVPLATEKDLIKMMNARMHSLNMSEQQFEELKLFSEFYKDEFNKMMASETPFQSKETKVKLAMMLHDNNRDAEIKNLLRDGVDVLRFAAMLSHRRGISWNNVELKPVDKHHQIAFKLNNSEKKLIRSLLNNCVGLYNDIWKQEKIFKNLMNRLGTKSDDMCPARVVKAFDNLANGRKVDEDGHPIYNANKIIPEAIEVLNKTGNASRLNNIAQNRPGDFLRTYISSVEHTNPEFRDRTINAIRHCDKSSSIAMKDLLTVKNQLDFVMLSDAALENEMLAARVFKHHGKHFVTVRKQTTLTSKEIDKMRVALMETAANMVNGYQQLGNVYIDPELTNVKAPGREMRGASGGSVLTPYSTIQTDKNKNLLVFGIRWERVPGTTQDWLDVDLSAHMYGADYVNKGHVSYSNLRNSMAIHSGDYTHICPSGHSTEAILLDKSRLAAHGVRYVVAEVHCFNIKSFREAGNCKFVYEQKEGSFDAANYSNKSYYAYNGDYMASRDNGTPVFLGEVFEPSQLENCITLNSDGTTTVPLVYDLEKDCIIWLDMTLDNRYKNMLRQTENPRIMTSVMAEIERANNNPYPSVKDIVECYSHFNGTIVDDIAEAETVFMREHVDREQLGIKEDARVITAFDLDILSKEFSGNDDQSKIVEEKTEEPVVEEKVVTEPPLLRQMRLLRNMLNSYPYGV